MDRARSRRSLSGFDVLTAVRADGCLRALPVVVLSASTDPRDVLRSYALGANGSPVVGCGSSINCRRQGQDCRAHADGESHRCLRAAPPIRPDTAQRRAQPSASRGAAAEDQPDLGLADAANAMKYGGIQNPRPYPVKASSPKPAAA
jgi:hypothetical protein